MVVVVVRVRRPVVVVVVAAVRRDREPVAAGRGTGPVVARPVVVGGRGAERGGSGRRSFEVSGGAVLLIRFVHVRDSGGSGNTAVVDALVFGLFQTWQCDERVALA